MDRKEDSAGNDPVVIGGAFVPGLLFGGVLFAGAGFAMFWAYFAPGGNPPLLVFGLVILLVGLLFFYLLARALATSFVVDSAGITQTGLFRGVTHIEWKSIAGASEEPGVEHGLVILKLASRSGARVDVYSNWMNDYGAFFELVNSYVRVDTSRTREQLATSAGEADAIRLIGSVNASGEAVGRRDESTATVTGVRMKVTATQILYALGTLAMATLMIWRAAG